MKHFVARISLFVLRMLLIVLISIGLYHFGTFAFTFGRQIYSEEGMTAAPGKDVAVVVSEGESTKEIAQITMVRIIASAIAYENLTSLNP